MDLYILQQKVPNAHWQINLHLAWPNLCVTGLSLRGQRYWGEIFERKQEDNTALRV